LWFAIFVLTLVYAPLAGYGFVPHPWPVVVVVSVAGAWSVGMMSAPR
jgi:hypothetical protein